MRVLLVVGYEATSSNTVPFITRTSLTRYELLAYGGEPNNDQLSNSLPYLDAVVHETLRLRSPVTELFRIVHSLSFHLCLTLTSHVSGNRGRCDTPFRACSHSIW